LTAELMGCLDAAAATRTLRCRGRRPYLSISVQDERALFDQRRQSAGTARARRAGLAQGKSPARGAPDPAPRSGAA
jgi:hypothetical protein